MRCKTLSSGAASPLHISFTYHTHTLVAPRKLPSHVARADRVIGIINEFYTPLALNATVDKFASAQELPALRHVAAAYQSNWRFEFGFASCVFITPDGEHVLGWTGGTAEEREFLEAVVGALERNKILQAAKQKLARGDMSGWRDIGDLVAQVTSELQKRHSEVLQKAATMGK